MPMPTAMIPNTSRGMAMAYVVSLDKVVEHSILYFNPKME